LKPRLWLGFSPNGGALVQPSIKAQNAPMPLNQQISRSTNQQINGPMPLNQQINRSTNQQINK
jgi:hypothetical protein